MSVAFYIVLDNPEPGFDTFVNGKAFAHWDELDAVVERLGLKTPYDFIGGEDGGFGAEDFADEVDEYSDEEDEAAIDTSGYSWFEPGEGIEYFSQLKSHLQEEGSETTDVEAVIEDLDEYIAVLEKAAAIEAKWCLLLDY